MISKKKDRGDRRSECAICTCFCIESRKIENTPVKIFYFVFAFPYGKIEKNKKFEMGGYYSKK